MPHLSECNVNSFKKYFASYVQIINFISFIQNYFGRRALCVRLNVFLKFIDAFVISL